MIMIKKMNRFNEVKRGLLILACVLSLFSCKDSGKTYSEWLEEEEDAIEAFIKGKNISVTTSMPTGTSEWMDGQKRLFYKYESGVPSKNIRYATDATLNDMRMQLLWLKQVMEAYDGDARAIVYYSGHGMPSEDGSHAYLLPIDGNSKLAASGLSTTALYQQLGEMPSKGTMVFLDACFSGSRRDGQMLASSRGVAIKAKTPSVKGNMVVFSASQGDETAYPYTQKRHGLFTYYLLEQLQQHGGYISLGELSDQVSKQVKRVSIVENSKTQSPAITASAENTNWQQWLFASKRATRYETVQRSVATSPSANSNANIHKEAVVHQATSRDPLLPLWIKETVVNKWLGVSPPTPDMKKGRSIALINAALSYLRSQQVGKLKTAKKMEITNVQTGPETAESTYAREEASMVEYGGFNCKVTDEYYNIRGEYFVRCAFTADEKSTNNRLIISQNIKKNTSGEGSHVSVSVEIAMNLNGQQYQCSLESEQKNALQPTILIETNKVPFRTYKNLNYEQTVWNTDCQDGALTFTTDDLGQSLGVTQMAFYTLLPFVPQEMNVSALTESTQTSIEDRFSSVSQLLAETLCRPIDITPVSLSNKGYVVKVHATNMANVDYSEPTYDSLTKTMMYHDFERSKTLGGFGRLLSVHDILSDAYWQVASMISTEIAYEQSSDKNAGAAHKTHNNIKEIGVKWDFENPANWENNKAKANASDVDNAPRGIWVKVKCQ